MTDALDVSDFPPPLIDALAAEGLMELEIVEPLMSGANNVARVVASSGRSAIVKYHYGPEQAGPATGKPDFYPLEAEGLEAIAATGARVPRVISVGPEHLMLEDVGRAGPLDWAEAGRTIARIHLARAGRFGFAHDNYAGVVPQVNDWNDDGHDFYIRQRLLPLLDDPRCREMLEPDDTARVERFASRLRELLPPMEATLTHGDLWLFEHDGAVMGNLIGVEGGAPVVIDPGVSYCWPELDLSYVWGIGHAFGWTPPDEFLEGYRELRALEPGWEERFEILHVRGELFLAAHEGDGSGSLPRLRELLDRYA